MNYSTTTTTQERRLKIERARKWQHTETERGRRLSLFGVQILWLQDSEKHQQNGRQSHRLICSLLGLACLIPATRLASAPSFIHYSPSEYQHVHSYSRFWPFQVTNTACDQYSLAELSDRIEHRWNYTWRIWSLLR